MYLYTKNEGKVLLIRGGKSYILLSGNSSASGKIQAGDVFVFTTGDINLSELNKINNFLQIKKILDEANMENYVLVSFDEQHIEESDKEYIVSPVKSKKNPFLFLHTLKNFQMKQNGKRTVTIFVIAILAILFTWSVVFGVQRRHRQESQKKIEIAKQIIQAKLDEADDVSTLNVVRAQSLVTEAKNTLQELKKTVGNSNEKDIDLLSSLITEKEKVIFKNQDKQYEEFYDLTLIKPNVDGQAIALFGDNISIIDKTGNVYLLSLSKKSQETVSNSALAGIHLITQWEDSTFLLNDKGIYRALDLKVKQVVKSDGWGKIAGFSVYNNNLYVLDETNKQIYKYVVTDSGYSDKTNYLKDQKNDFSDANSLVIDSSLYVGQTETIQKYTGGLKDVFKFSIPNIDTLSIEKVYTNQDSQKIYILDKTASSIFVLSKEGTYEKRIYSPIIKNVTDFVITEQTKKILLLSHDKIYSISLD
jgi:hypothetical protein